MNEKDPYDRNPHDHGAKLDAGKLRIELVLGGFARALRAVSKIGTDGAAKYTEDGWMYVPNGIERYADAAGRHRLARQAGELYDPASGDLHLAHEAWNVLAQLDLTLRTQEQISHDLNSPKFKLEKN